MYIRIKRKKQTFFVSCEPGETVLEIKNKMQILAEQGPEHLLLRKGEVILEDAKTLADQQVGNDDIISMQFRDGDSFEPLDLGDGDEEEE